MTSERSIPKLTELQILQLKSSNHVVNLKKIIFTLKCQVVCGWQKN